MKECDCELEAKVRVERCNDLFFQRSWIEAIYETQVGSVRGISFSIEDSPGLCIGLHDRRGLRDLEKQTSEILIFAGRCSETDLIRSELSGQVEGSSDDLVL